jgi:hypothetical protein
VQTDSGLGGPPIGSAAELLDRIAVIEQALPPEDGLASFNRVYRRITEAVQQELGVGGFGDPVWMEHLDVVFGNRYLAAVRASVSDPDQVPRAWAALLERRSDRRITPLQFALAGVNAHINYDLPIAVVETSADLGTTLEAAPHRSDYERINLVLAAAEPAIRASFEDDLLRAADQAVPGLQDVVANFNLVKARETAWAHAEVLWTLRQTNPSLETEYLAGLDHLVGFAGRGLLVPLLVDDSRMSATMAHT